MSTRYLNLVGPVTFARSSVSDQSVRMTVICEEFRYSANALQRVVDAMGLNGSFVLDCHQHPLAASENREKHECQDYVVPLNRARFTNQRFCLGQYRILLVHSDSGTGWTFVLSGSRCKRRLFLLETGCSFTEALHFQVLLVWHGIYFHHFLWNRVVTFLLQQGQAPGSQWHTPILQWWECPSPPPHSSPPPGGVNKGSRECCCTYSPVWLSKKSFSFWAAASSPNVSKPWASRTSPGLHTFLDKLDLPLALSPFSFHHSLKDERVWERVFLPFLSRISQLNPRFFLLLGEAPQAWQLSHFSVKCPTANKVAANLPNSSELASSPAGTTTRAIWLLFRCDASLYPVGFTVLSSSNSLRW